MRGPRLEPRVPPSLHLTPQKTGLGALSIWPSFPCNPPFSPPPPPPHRQQQIFPVRHEDAVRSSFLQRRPWQCAFFSGGHPKNGTAAFNIPIGSLWRAQPHLHINSRCDSTSAGGRERNAQTKEGHIGTSQHPRQRERRHHRFNDCSKMQSFLADCAVKGTEVKVLHAKMNAQRWKTCCVDHVSKAVTWCLLQTICSALFTTPYFPLSPSTRNGNHIAAPIAGGFTT